MQSEISSGTRAEPGFGNTKLTSFAHHARSRRTRNERSAVTAWRVERKATAVAVLVACMERRTITMLDSVGVILCS